jgi:hypothetical protein
MTQTSKVASRTAMSDRIQSTAVAAIFLRLALAAGFLSAVADRFGLWGPPGTPGVERTGRQLNFLSRG